MFKVNWTTTVHIPELKKIGDILMAGLQEIRDAIVEQGEALAAELDQMAQRPVIDPAEVTALAEMVRGNTEQMKRMVDDEEPPVGAQP